MQQAVSSKFSQGANEGGQAPMMYPVEMINDAQKLHGNSQMDLTAQSQKRSKAGRAHQQ